MNKRFICDFECTTSEPTQVYIWVAYDVDNDKYYDGSTIKSFIEFVESNPYSDFFFHNLKYDGSFIFDYLIRHKGVKHNHTGYPTFNTLQGTLDDFSYIYDFDKYVNFYDTMSILTGSLRTFGESLGLTKGDTQSLAMYTNEELKNLSEEDLIKAKEYCRLDVEILAKVCMSYHVLELMQIKRTKAGLAYAGVTLSKIATDTYTFRIKHKPKKPKIEDIKHKQVTTVVYCSNGKKYSKSFYESMKAARKRQIKVVEEKEEEFDVLYEKIIHRTFKEFKYQIDNFTFYENTMQPYRLKYSKKIYGENLYLSTQDVDMDKISKINGLIKSSYKGGLNYVNPDYQNVWINDKIYIYDINSMYPFIYSSMPIPDIRTAKLTKELEKDDLGFVIINKINAIVKQGKFPLIKLKTGLSHPNAIKYLSEIQFRQPFTLTNIEYQYLLENYDIKDIEVITFIKMDRNDLLEKNFKQFCDYWYKEKEHSRKTKNKTREYFSKLMLNSLYGKFGQYNSKYSSFSFNETMDKENEKIYTDSMWDADVSVASYITAYGRVMLANEINSIGMDKFIYCDTDSLHLLCEIDNVGSGIGQWKLEGVSNKSKFIQTKTYGETINGKWKTVCAGFTDLIPEDRFESGMKVNVKRSFIVKGGTVIKDVEVTLGNLV